ncbi:helix-turn-helix domain-containing protein [Actinoalloteichus sp. GBA129-24]|uniref:helix-turn-helix domain-containing protein n=1 Tax=Actinoalloteichus sp. GBA129-24 TaxID=1612551 RepID=UPI0018DD087A|nr:helix-turn-helix transcriptional regulator [Actinoalloteichus sp. GBA129-24]
MIQRLVLGAELRELREASRITPEEAATSLRWYNTKISKIEHGDAKLTEGDVSKLLALYDASEATADRVRLLAKEARRKVPAARVTDWAKKYVALEASATEIKMWFGDSVPGLFQTKDYARAVLSASVVVPSVDVDEMAESRTRRALRLTEPTAPLVWAILGEEAIQRPVGGAVVLRGQLEHIRDLARLDHVTVQIMPQSAGEHPGLNIAFTLLHIADARATFAYIESLTSADYLPRPRHTQAYSLVFDRLRVAALSERDSLAMINQQIARLG